MPSLLSSSVRVAPQQERSARRLAGFLQAAAELFAEVGFEATTMQAIADRSNSSIGALYNYFPDKESIAVTLRLQYSEELRARLKLLMEEATKQSPARFAKSFIDCILDLMHQRPAYLALHSTAIRVHREPAARKALRSMIADVFRAKNPSLSPERALLAANVAVQIVKGMTTLYSELETKSRAPIEAEFRKVLTSYLEGVLSRSRGD